MGLGFVLLKRVGSSLLGVYTSRTGWKADVEGHPVPPTTLYQLSHSRLGASLWLRFGDHCSFGTVVMKFGSTETESRPFWGGLNIIKRLDPVTFIWKGGAMRDIGLNAEDVAEVEPLLVTRNDKGEVEDLKENSLDLVFINAFREQQKQLEALQEQVRRQQQQIDALKKLICSANSQGDLRKEEK
jgi:hypothetical protein